jgi:hypothetical protein
MFFCIAILTAAVFGYLSFQDRHRMALAWASRKWRPTVGKVISLQDNSFDIDSANQVSVASSTRYYEDLITVKYEVNATVFTTGNYSFGDHIDQPWAIHQIGQTVTVFYDPSQPERSVVKRGIPVSLLVCPALFLLGLYWIAASVTVGGNR